MYAFPKDALSSLQSTVQPLQNLAKSRTTLVSHDNPHCSVRYVHAQPLNLNALPVPWTPGTGITIFLHHPQSEGVLVAHTVITGREHDMSHNRANELYLTDVHRGLGEH